ncbi:MULTISPECIES: hypothetical protein [Glycomyces]|uniref:Uncharacterized protein n=2 Tax=Glycomyces TaxID=58113 RepID=A0A9X3T729_9ACTN|nr:hypothetical protein [Glycomyces lechevalierae]MDA1383758.1 hypothetical protein [Glycomyces lechevalierae]MDR7341251.1 hypothetical protein [Glycomyces lechevalierae]
MRNRTIVGAALAVTALGGASVAGVLTAGAAENESRYEPVQTATEAASEGALMLPTGDVVRLSPGGRIDVEPAAGREDVGFVGQTAKDGSGDVVVVPADMLDAVRSGAEDPRRYNVSRLLAAGHSDAAAVTEAELDDRAYTGLVPAPEPAEASDAAQQLTVRLLDRSGDAPEGAVVSWIREGETGGIEIGEDGTGTTALEPGEYLISTLTVNATTATERGEAVYGFTPVTVGKGPAELVVDAAAAAPVGVEVERDDAELEKHLLYVEAGTESDSVATFEFMDAGTDAYVLPQPEASGYAFNFLYQPVLAGPADAADPYTYTLAFGGAGPIPADPFYEVADADLAVEQTEYQDLGVELQGRQCDYPRAWKGQFFLFGQCAERAFPSEATNLYSAAPILWDQTVEAGVFDENSDLTDGYTSLAPDVAMPAGPAERVIGDGPLAAGSPHVVRNGDTISGLTWPVASHSGDIVRLVGYESGGVTVSRDGEVLGTAKNPENFSIDLPEGDQGRYTLTVEATRGTETALYGIESIMEWSFDSATAEEAVLDLPVVLVESEAVQHGLAERDEPQTISLALDSMETTVESMGLEVSYDDGETWTEAELEGDTAVLEHPAGAEFVSLRLTATDSAGTEVTHTTIRSYGLC